MTGQAQLVHPRQKAGLNVDADRKQRGERGCRVLAAIPAYALHAQFCMYRCQLVDLLQPCVGGLAPQYKADHQGLSSMKHLGIFNSPVATLKGSQLVHVTFDLQHARLHSIRISL